MTCQYCYDRPIVKATGHNGEVVTVSCPVCGIAATLGIEIVPASGRVSHDVEAKGDEKKRQSGAPGPYPQ